MPEARPHDESTIAVEVHGRGPTVLLPVYPQPGLVVALPRRSGHPPDINARGKVSYTDDKVRRGRTICFGR
jgi:hypothetical protein